MRKLIVAASLIAVSTAVAGPYQGSAQNAKKNDAAIAFDRAVQDCQGHNLPWNQNSVAYVQVKCERERVLYRAEAVDKKLAVSIPADMESMKISARTDKYSVKGLEIGQKDIDFEATYEGAQRCAKISEIKETFKTGYMTLSCDDIAQYASLEEVCSDKDAESAVAKKYEEAKKNQDSKVLFEEVTDSWESCGSVVQDAAQQQK
jgi:hypothetical protein